MLTQTYALHHGVDPVGNDKADTVLTMDVLKANRSSRAQSPLCSAQRCLVPFEPYQPSNLGGAHNDWQVVGDFRPLVSRWIRKGGLGTAWYNTPRGIPQMMVSLVVLQRIRLVIYASKASWYTPEE